MKALFLFALLATSAFAKPCYVVLKNDPKLDAIVEKMNAYMASQGAERDYEYFAVETIKWDRSECSQRTFLSQARNHHDDEFNWEPQRTQGPVREYTGSFFKLDNMEWWFMKPEVTIEKDLYNYFHALNSREIGSWKYLAYGVSDGSTNIESGAIMFNSYYDSIQYRIFIMTIEQH